MGESGSPERVDRILEERGRSIADLDALLQRMKGGQGMSASVGLRGMRSLSPPPLRATMDLQMRQLLYDPATELRKPGRTRSVLPSVRGSLEGAKRIYGARRKLPFVADQSEQQRLFDLPPLPSTLAPLIDPPSLFADDSSLDEPVDDPLERLHDRIFDAERSREGLATFAKNVSCHIR